METIKQECIQVLMNYRDQLETLYMSKRGIRFNLEKLSSQTGLNLKDYDGSGKANFTNHIELKESLKDYCISPEKRVAVFEWIISEFGGIKTSKDNSVFATTYEMSNESTLIDNLVEKGRVASWSKIISFLEPRKYFIYDARVAFTVNYLLGENHFPIPYGRNKVINAHVNKRSQPSASEYYQYCELIQDIHSLIWDTPETKDKPYLTEMLLFALLNDQDFISSIPDGYWAN